MGGTVLRLFIASTLLAACGSVKDSGIGIDAAPADASVDADETGTATIVTESALFGDTVGARAGNIEVVSMLPNNTVLETKTTDGAGTTTIKVYPGGTVTAVYRHTADMGADLITWAGVQPNDTLHFGLRTFQPASGTPNPSIGSQTYQYPAQPGVTTFQVFSSCGGRSAAAPATAVAFDENALCHREPMDVLYVGLAGSQISHYNFRQNVPFANGGTVTIGGWANAQTVTASITGLPAEVTNLSGRFGVVLDDATERTLSGGFFNGAPTGGAFTAMFPWATTGNRTIATLDLGRAGNFFSTRVIDGLPFSATSWTVASPELPPWLEGQFLVSPANGNAAWSTLEQPGAVHDAVVLALSWNETIASTNHRFQWSFVLPPGSTGVDFPALPPQFNDYLPKPETGIGLNELRFLELPSANGYDAIRALPSSTVLCVECAVRAGDLQRVILSGT